MLVELLKISALLALLVAPLSFPFKRKNKAIKIPKNYNDTSEAHYAVNEHGFLEEIDHDKSSSHAQ
ncbi:MAG TPA: hypothetical protein VIM16_05010 [Mucilaginibacter sp.]|jgi:hypothetical protein